MVGSLVLHLTTIRLGKRERSEMGLVAAGGSSCSRSSISMELRWVTRKRREQGKRQLHLRPSMVPIYISTNPSDVNPKELRQLFISCNHSCRRFPKLVTEDGTIPTVEEAAAAVDINKLRVALSHSCVIVSLFSRTHHNDFDADSDDNSSKQWEQISLLGNLTQRVMPVTPSNGQLVGFGRAVSDVGLTASIHDVMVIPSLRRMGIGRMIVQRIVRMLTSKDIYDIAALCSEEERLFFKACGFGDDILGSTTMMYTRL